LINAVNSNTALEAGDGANVSDLLDQGNGFYGFLINASSPGFQASEIQAVFTSSTHLTVMPAGNYFLEDNLPDLEPRAHVYLSSGATSLALQSSLDTTRFADGFHTLTIVAYEGTSVRTQTRVQETLQFRNTTLSATFTTMSPATNGDLQFGVAASATNIAQIQLFSRGGCVAVSSNQATAELAAPASTLGVGLLPFYAVVTDSAGHQYQTQTVWEQIPALELSVISAQTLSWPAIAGRQYTIESATNLPGAWQEAGTVLATNAPAQWTIPGMPGGAAFYRIVVTP
jgi:hypothetical protein